MARTSTACVAPVDVHSRRVVSVGWAALALVGQQGATACPCRPRITPARRLRHRTVGGAACQQHGAFRGASHGRCAHDRDGADAVPRGPTQPPGIREAQPMPVPPTCHFSRSGMSAGICSDADDAQHRRCPVPTHQCCGRIAWLLGHRGYPALHAVPSDAVLGPSRSGPDQPAVLAITERYRGGASGDRGSAGYACCVAGQGASSPTALLHGTRR